MIHWSFRIQLILGDFIELLIIKELYILFFLLVAFICDLSFENYEWNDPRP